MQLDLTDDDMFVVQPRNTLPKNQHPQSPGEAMMQAQLSSPFARQPTPRLATTPQMPAIPSHATSDARHRLSAVGALPAPLALAIRQLELQPQAMPCSVSCGTGGLCWAALDGALHVWKASAPQGCRKLISPLPSEMAHAELVCEVQPGGGKADEALLLVCWALKDSGAGSSCRLTLYGMQKLSEAAPFASPPPIAEIAVPLQPGDAPTCLRATPGTIAPAPAAAAAILGTGASVYSIGLEPLGGTVESSGYRLSLAPVERGSGSVSAIFKSVSSYFSSSSSSTTSNAKLATLTLASDWMVTLSTAQQAPNQPEGKMLDCYKRTGAGQPYTHTGTYPLGPLVKEYLDTTGMGNQGSHVADIALMPPGEAAIGQGKLFILLALQSHAADANCELVLIDATISSTGSVRLASPLPPKPSTSIASLPASDAATLRLAASQRTLGPAVAMCPSAGGYRAIGGGEAWALRDVAGDPSAELIGIAGGTGAVGLLGPMPDAKLLGACGDEQGVVLLYSHQIVRIASLPPRPPIHHALRDSHGRAMGAAGPPSAADDAFLVKLTDAFAQYEAAQKDGWHGATELGRGVEEAAAIAPPESAPKALLALSEQIASASPAQSAAQLTAKLSRHKMLIQFGRLHALIDAAKYPTIAAKIIAHGERLAAGLALRQIQNGSMPSHSTLLIAVMEEVVRRLPPPNSPPGSEPDAQEAFYGGLLQSGRWEGLLSSLATAASGVVAEEQRMGRIAFLCECAVKPLIAARSYRSDMSTVLYAAASSGADAAEAAAITAGVKHWTCAADICDEPLLALSGSACGALQSITNPLSLTPSEAEMAAGLVDSLSAMHEERLIGVLSTLSAIAPELSSEALSLKPPALAAFEKAREDAAAALIGCGALPHSAVLAESFHDYKTLGALCTRLPPSLPPHLLRGRRLTSAADLRHELVARLAAAAPPSPLYTHEEATQKGFVHELCFAHYEAGAAGCRELLRLPETYPFLAEPLRTFLASYPRLLWLHLVDEASHATDPTAASTSFDDAARALYAWGLQTANGVPPVERKAFLSLGKLCHRASVLGKVADPNAPASASSAAAAAAAAGVPPPLPPPPPSLDALPKVNGVRVTIEGERRETEMEVGLRDVANEQYALRVQEELQLGGEARPTEEMIASLLKHASDPNGQQAPLALHGEPLDRDAALALALDLAQKTAWRYNTSDGGIAARRTTLVRILHTALSCELTLWRDLANELSRLNDTQLVAALGGSAAGHPIAGTGPLALFALLAYQAAKAAAAAAVPAEDDEWLSAGAAPGENSMVAQLVASVKLPEGGEVKRVIALIKRAQTIAEEHANPQPVGSVSNEEEWVRVDAMQM